MTQDLSLVLDSVEKISEKYESFSEETRNSISELKASMRCFRAYVPFLGEFSVGKSSLLNDWLGEELLPEAQGATTALATELLPGSTAEMVVVAKDGTKRSLPALPKDAEDANAREASDGEYAYCTTPAVNLAKVAPIIPVDMPGINSGIKRHTEALYRYANKGKAFFLVFSPDQGTIPGTMYTFLQELDLGKRPIWVAITKCDIVGDEKIENVTELIKKQLDFIGIETLGILHFSRENGKTATILQNAFLQLDPEELNRLDHLDDALRVVMRLKSQLCILRDSQKFDARELDKQIRDCKKAKEELISALSVQEKTLSKKLNNLPYLVGEDTINALQAHTEELIRAYEGGEELFTIKMAGIINNIIQNSIDINLKKNIDEVTQNIAKDLHIEDMVISGEKLRNSVALASDVLYSLSKILKTIKSAGKIYKVVTTALAVTTTIVGPIIELIIIFLPDLISIFVNNEENKRNKIREALIRQIFPQIQSKIIDEIQNILPDLKRELIEELHKEWMERIEDAEIALEDAKKSKKDAEERSQNIIVQLNTDIMTLEKILDSLKAPAC